MQKVLLAERLGRVADPLYAKAVTQALTFGEAWTAALAFSFQLLLDFSAYSTMAIGIALMMGFVFPENFDRPYLATDLRVFWRRWHMSLGAFLRDYVYIPLGGSRSGRGRFVMATLGTMVLCGVWHGAAWTFIAWGAMHGVGMVVVWAWQRLGRPLPILAAWALTMLFVIAGWVLFRATGFSAAAGILGSMAGVNGFTGGLKAAPLLAVSGLVCLLLPPNHAIIAQARPSRLVAAASALATVACILDRRPGCADHLHLLPVLMDTRPDRSPPATRDGWSGRLAAAWAPLRERLFSARDDASAWRGMARTAAVTLAGGLALVCGVIFLVDPYDVVPFSPRAERPMMDLNQRWLYPGVARSGRFDSYVIGTSTIRLLDPERLDRAFGGRFANLAMNSATAWEQDQLARVILRAGGPPRTLVIGIDTVWCARDADTQRITFRGFPEWMYDDNRWNDLLHLLNGKTLEIAGRLLGYWLGLTPAALPGGRVRGVRAAGGELRPRPRPHPPLSRRQDPSGARGPAGAPRAGGGREPAVPGTRLGRRPSRRDARAHPRHPGRDAGARLRPARSRNGGGGHRAGLPGPARRHRPQARRPDGGLALPLGADARGHQLLVPAALPAAHRRAAGGGPAPGCDRRQRGRRQLARDGPAAAAVVQGPGPSIPGSDPQTQTAGASAGRSTENPKAPISASRTGSCGGPSCGRTSCARPRGCRGSGSRPS